MEIWFIILIITISAALLLNLLSPPNSNPPSPPLPPGPRTIPLIGRFLWLRKIRSGFEPILLNLHARFGPIITIRLRSRHSVFIADRTLAHQALVQNGVVFSGRPKSRPTSKVISSNQHTINTAAYGPTWRLFRRNLTAEILHPSRIKSYSHSRSWVLQILFDRLNSEINGGAAIQVVNHFQYAIFFLIALMCFGDKLDENQIKLIEDAQRRMLVNGGKFNYLNFWPRVTKILLGHKWAEFLNIRKGQEEAMIPLIQARKQIKEGKLNNVDNDDGYVLAYVDTLLDLQLPEEEGKRRLDEGEVVSLCSEFLNAGTETTSTAFQWVMANLVKYPNVQEKLFNEIQGVMGEIGGGEVKEDDLQKMPYLKAVMLEGLRRHPPGHFVLPHSMSEDAVLGGYLVPKGSNVNFLVAEMGWDPKMWEDPMEFKPERFLSNGGEVEFDITGSREIKMMPFGAGRRICPGIELALLHLEYFVANLVWKFEWKAVEGDEVSLEKKQVFITVMKYPLKALISPRKGY